MAKIQVADPRGGNWRVWRRWYAWRRWVELRDVGRALGQIAGIGGSGDRYGTDDEVGCLLALPFLLLAALGLVVSLVDLAAQLLVLPFFLLARLVGLARWPVQLDRENKHVRTFRVRGFAAAGRLRDATAAQIRDGSLPDVATTPDQQQPPEAATRA